MADQLDRVIEDVARAIAWEDLTPHGRRTAEWPRDFGPTECDEYRARARAALLAALKGIREPTPEMCLVGKFQLYDCNERGCGDAIRHTFGKMLDRLIAEVESQHG